MPTHASVSASARLALEKRSDGELYLGEKRVVRELSGAQRKGMDVPARRLYQELRHRTVLTPSHCALLRGDPTVIPDDWKVEPTVFFEEIDGDLRAVVLFWRDGCRWDQGYVLPDDKIEFFYKVAVLSP